MIKDIIKEYEEYVNWCLNLNIKPISFDEFKNNNNEKQYE
jgi:hypothetical protein